MYEMPANYEDYVISGDWHYCECGRRYSDSDGGACHEKCRTMRCTNIVYRGDDYCRECMMAHKANQVDVQDDVLP